MGGYLSNVTVKTFRKKLKGTCDYIYQTLFLDGEGSDVTIHALGKYIRPHLNQI